MMNNANGQRDIDPGYSFERTPRDAPAVWVRVDPGSDLRDELAWIARTAGEPLRLKTSVHDVRTWRERNNGRTVNAFHNSSTSAAPDSRSGVRVVTSFGTTVDQGRCARQQLAPTLRAAR